MNIFRLAIIASLSLAAVFLSCTDSERSQKEQWDGVAESGGDQLLPDPGVVSYTFRHEFEEDVAGTLDMIKDMGFSHIEFSNLFGKTAQELRHMLDERGLVCTSYGVSYDALLNDIDRVAEEAHILGAKHVRVAWIPHESPFDIDDARRVVVDFNRIGRQLHNEGIAFSYHNHGFEFSEYKDGTLFDYIVSHTDPEYVHFEMDIVWVVWPGYDPIKLLNQYPDRFRLAHLDDYEKGLEGDLTDYSRAEKSVPIGQGAMDYHAFLTAAQNSSIEYFYIEDETDDPVNRVPVSLEYLKSITR